MSFGYIELGAMEKAESSLYWLWDVSFNNVTRDKEKTAPGTRHRPLLMYPTPFGNPRKEELEE